jgi:hypothetical protein
MLLKILGHKANQNAGNRITIELNYKNSSSTKNHQIREHSMEFEGQDHQEKRHTNLMCDSQNKSHKETPPKASHEDPKKEL